MNIQWYPGHMTKSIRMIEENLKLVDAVIYVLDARAVLSCLNPSFDKLITDKKKLFILNKSDLSDDKVNRLWEKNFKSQGESALILNGTVKKLTEVIIKELTLLLAEKIERQRKKGIVLPLRAMVIGVPNSGKSTIINTLFGGKRTLTGDKPGVTRSKQWVKLGNGIELLDTPGTLWNAFADQATAKHLAYIGSIKEEILDIEELAENLLEELKVLYPDLLAKKYGVDVNLSGKEMMLFISRKKGCLLKGEEDTARCAKAIIDDFKKARIGRISLERP